ncbi:MAG: heat-inducible transcription repressor HrcA [Clostridiaceae bacterium]|jgi:heat-inducible transcriptional repressor|nr:heat-inducible transcription repressor HrcA [Clostridiaceae bacterium]
MLLDDRKRKILKAIIDDYINTAEPVGSRSVARKHGIGLSSATIRNEMADLEDMGLLEQPHTSAGRVPSDKGYRVYVDQLMTRRQLSSDEIVCIEDSMKAELNELEQLIKQASAVVSEVTKYTSLAITPQMSKSTLKTIKLILVADDTVLVIVVTNAGIVKNSMVRAGSSVSIDSLIVIANFLSDKLSGITLEKVNLEDLKYEAEKIMTKEKYIIEPILYGVEDCINQIYSTEVFLDGTTNIFNFPEFQDMIRARQFFNILSTKDVLCTLMFRGIQGESLKVRIGIENEMDELKDFTLITATYSLGREIIGSIGVIGPTRMHYPRVIESLNYMRRVINRKLNHIIIGDDVEGQ